MFEDKSEKFPLEAIYEAFVGQAVEAKCVKCGAVEFVIALDEPLDEAFLANFHCDLCDSECNSDHPCES